jgi:intein-encoded DNA endonuclease-like protein
MFSMHEQTTINSTKLSMDYSAPKEWRIFQNVESNSKSIFFSPPKRELEEVRETCQGQAFEASVAQGR